MSVSPELENMTKAAFDNRSARLNIGRETFVMWDELSEEMRADQIADMRAGLETLLRPGEGTMEVATQALERWGVRHGDAPETAHLVLTAAISHILGEP